MTEKPGELLKCEVCKQAPQSLAFSIKECTDNCPFKIKEKLNDRP